MRIKNTVGNVHLIFLKIDQSCLVKFVLIMHNKCSKAGIAHNYANRSKAEQRTLTNLAHSDKQLAERKHLNYRLLAG